MKTYIVFSSGDAEGELPCLCMDIFSLSWYSRVFVDICFNKNRVRVSDHGLGFACHSIAKFRDILCCRISQLMNSTDDDYRLHQWVGDLLDRASHIM